MHGEHVQQVYDPSAAAKLGRTHPCRRTLPMDTRSAPTQALLDASSFAGRMCLDGCRYARVARTTPGTPSRVWAPAAGPRCAMSAITDAEQRKVRPGSTHHCKAWSAKMANAPPGQQGELDPLETRRWKPCFRFAGFRRCSAACQANLTQGKGLKAQRNMHKPCHEQKRLNVYLRGLLRNASAGGDP